MEDIKNFINSEYESKHYNVDEMIETNKGIIKWLEESNDSLIKDEEEWG